MTITRTNSTSTLNVRTLGPVKSGKQTYINNKLNHVRTAVADSVIHSVGLLWAGMTDNAPQDVIKTDTYTLAEGE